MMAQFMMDLKTEPRLSPSLYSPASPKMIDSNGRPQSTDSGVLDLSKRRDSLDARKTPSPSYHCYSEVGGTPPPSNHSSPQQCDMNVSTNPENTILLNYGELVRARRLSPTKSLLHFEELAHHTQTQLAPAVQAFHRHGMGLPKPETDILQQHLLQQAHRAGPIPSYLLPTAALQHHPHHQQQQTSPAAFSPSPIRLRELDTLSESGSEGTSLVSSSQRKCKEEGGNPPKDGAPSGNQQYPMVVGRDGKLSRPFKAYPRDPLSLAAGFVASDTILDTNSAEKYNLFRKRMLEQIHAANGGQPTVSNPKMRRLANSTKSGTSSSNAPSAAMSDASSSESCDEKPPSKEHVLSMAAAKAHQSLTTCGEMAQYTATNQRPLVTPSRNETLEAACDVIGSSDVSPSSRAESSGTAATPALNHSNSGSSVKDSAYYERRKKNNAAAKKSRDRRRIKEDEIAIRAAFLERENIELKFELAAARKQLALYGVTSSVAAS
ncbi:protein giant [Anopheles marshallii]|uniref:protein giant n=1 Tax=Anopheles marshallii TaxID=1521116 RepID=UPI00237AC6D3|nr:protein giant [Anopheles marshallii]